MSMGGLSKTRLDRMHEVMVRHVERGEVPGIVTLVSRQGQVHVDAIGTKAESNSAPMQRDSIFRIASMTKPITAAATMILVEECKLRLDDPIDKLLPELAKREVLKSIDGPLVETVPAHRPISVRDLLTLRMGFGFIMRPSSKYPIQEAVIERNVAVTPERSSASSSDSWISALGSLPLMYQPGEKWMYDTSFDVLGILIERATGQPLELFFRERIFEPLGMKDTSFMVSASNLDRFATCYRANNKTGALEIFDDPSNSAWRHPPTFAQASSGLVSTIDDYLAFGQMMLNGGKHGTERILSRPSVELMTTDHLTLAQKLAAQMFLGENRGWGFGVGVVNRRDDIAAVPGRYGWEGGSGTSWSSDPQEQMVAILMTQLNFPASTEIYLDFWTSVYQAIDD